MESFHCSVVYANVSQVGSPGSLKPGLSILPMIVLPAGNEQVLETHVASQLGGQRGTTEL